jgi:KAP-like P-loop domain-containing protein
MQDEAWAVTEAKAIEVAALRVGLTDDNPADLDLLGFDDVVAPIVDALRQENLDPITVGVHAPWGGGKSTILGLLERELKGRTIVLRTNPWEYDDQFDVKGTLIAEVLTRLEAEVATDQDLKDKLADLFKRVSWSRVGMAVARGILTTQWDPAVLLDAFNPQNEEGPRSLADFREAFADLLSKIEGVDRVVVLVDDLDRCLPPAVLATLEAIKLFLSVKGMAFVIAADQDMIRDAIAATLSETNRSEVFAERYLEKIVQLPVGLPRLSQADSEAYIVLLLASASGSYSDIVKQVRERRNKNLVPFVDGAGIEEPLLPQIITLAAQIAEGLEPSKRGNPREIKRFLNAFGVRSSIAERRGVKLSPAVVVKLMFLETQHRPEFEQLVGLNPGERKEFLTAWESWGRGERKEKPASPRGGVQVRDETRSWAAAEPRLADEDLEVYISLAASFAAASVRGGLSDEMRSLVRDLISDSDAVQGTALKTVARKGLDEQRAIVEALIAESRRATDVTRITDALVAIGKAQASLAGDIAAGIQSRMWSKLEEACAVTLGTSGVAEFVDLARKMADDTALDAGVREAASQAVKGA